MRVERQQASFAFDDADPIAITRDLPADPVAAYRRMIEEHHTAVMAADEQTAYAIREKAHQLANDMNEGTNCGICQEDGTATYLCDQTAAPEGTIPLWGQEGNFIVTVHDMKVRVQLKGIFGIGSGLDFYPGFDAHIVDEGKPFFSHTGYRSFLGMGVQPVPNLTPHEYVRLAIEAYIASQPKSKRKRKAR